MRSAVFLTVTTSLVASIFATVSLAPTVDVNQIAGVDVDVATEKHDFVVSSKKAARGKKKRMKGAKNTCPPLLAETPKEDTLNDSADPETENPVATGTDDEIGQEENTLSPRIWTTLQDLGKDAISEKDYNALKEKISSMERSPTLLESLQESVDSMDEKRFNLVMGQEADSAKTAIIVKHASNLKECQRDALTIASPVIAWSLYQLSLEYRDGADAAWKFKDEKQVSMDVDTLLKILVDHLRILDSSGGEDLKQLLNQSESISIIEKVNFIKGVISCDRDMLDDAIGHQPKLLSYIEKYV